MKRNKKRAKTKTLHDEIKSCCEAADALYSKVALLQVAIDRQSCAVRTAAQKVIADGPLCYCRSALHELVHPEIRQNRAAIVAQEFSEVATARQLLTSVKL